MPQTIWSEFAPPAPGEWTQQARQELSGENPFEKLKITKGSLSIQPYYHEAVPASDRFALQPSAESFLGARGWANCPPVLVHDEARANDKALHHLNNGADGVFFRLEKGSTDVSRLLRNIELPYCSVYFSGTVTTGFIENFGKHCEEQSNQKKQGAFFVSEPMGADSIISIPGFHSLGITVNEYSTTEETIAKALAATVRTVESGSGKIPLQAIFENIAFSVSTHTDFFQEIAKLKSLRALYRLVASAYGIEAQAHVHVTSAAYEKAAFDPQSNLLKSTTAGLSAVLGGCDALTIAPADLNDSKLERLARNLSCVLREESQLHHVADPTAGSYYLDALVDELNEKAWTLFNTLVA